TMSTMLAFGFVPRGRFTLSDHRSFDQPIPHRFIHVPIHVPTSMTRQTCRHIDFSPIAITLVAGENSSTLSAAAKAPRPSRRARLCKASSAFVVTTPAPRPPRKVISVSATATTTPRRPHNASSAAVAASPKLASRPPQKVVIIVAASAT
ncbi:hypothetical protein ACLOJK_019669, partial [Asimina triloba]